MANVKGAPESSVASSASASQRALARLRLVIVLALLAPALLFAGAAWYRYQQAFVNARQELDAAAAVAKEHALKLFETNEMLLQRMLDLVGDADDRTLLARGRELHERLVVMSFGLPQIQGLFITGSDARMLASDRVYPPARNIDYSDREMFKAHREQQGMLFVTEQLMSRATGEPFFDLSRRRDYADGSFAGVVSSSLRPEYLTRFYEKVAQGFPDLRLAVVRDDGRPVASWPGSALAAQVPPDSNLGRRLAAHEESGSEDGLLSGEDRLRVFRRLEPYPLYVVAAIDRSAVLAGWRNRLGLIALVTVPIELGLLAMGWFALRRTRAEFDAMQRLSEETEHRQRVEIALQQSQKFEAMGRLTGGVAHDFNNLLMIIGSNSFLQQRLRPDLAGNKQMSAIDRAVDSGTKVTRQLLAFSRRQALLPERIDLQERLPALLELLRPLLGHAIELKSDIAADTAAIEADPAELELAIINLAINAKDAMPAGGGRVTVAVRNTPDVPEVGAGPFVLIEVTDTGCGIDPAIAGGVFEPFFTTKPVGHGTGLGLSQVRALCQSAGGDARIESRPGEGTRVSLYLRRAESPAAVPTTERHGVAQQLHCHVLLVEDNDAVAQATLSLLKEMGCDVVSVASGDAALSHIEANPDAVDVVLSDIEMPGGMDGIALGALVAAREPAIPVVLMTGYAGRLEQAVQQNLEVLPKPFSFDSLAEAIRRAVTRRPATRRQAVARAVRS